jgi:cell shape-determining protein MreC
MYIVQDDTRKVEMENYRLKSDLKHYKEMCHNVEMLREEKYSLESRVRNMDQLMAENMRLDILNARLQAEKLEW